MNRIARRIAGASRRLIQAIAASAMLGITIAPAPVHAADGCLVLLCLAAPSWKSIPQCVDPVRDLIRDLARGRPFPSCSMSSTGSHASHQWAYAPGNCPAQYTEVVARVDLPSYTCRFSGVISVTVNSTPWSRVWWNADDSVTEYATAAKAQLSSWDARFDDDFAQWSASQTPLSPEDRN